MGIYLTALSQNSPTKFVVWMFGGRSTVPPPRSSLALEWITCSVLSKQIRSHEFYLILDYEILKIVPKNNSKYYTNLRL